MKGSDFLDEMENISPELIEAAYNKAAGRKSRVMRYTALAASIFLVVAGASVLFKKPVKPEPVAPVGEGSEKVYDAAKWGSKAGEAFRSGQAFSVLRFFSVSFRLVSARF